MRPTIEGAGLIARFPQRDLLRALKTLAKSFRRHISSGRIRVGQSYFVPNMRSPASPRPGTI